MKSIQVTVEDNKCEDLAKNRDYQERSLLPTKMKINPPPQKKTPQSLQHLKNVMCQTETY